MPRLSNSIKVNSLFNIIDVGEQVHTDEVIAEVETDKVNVRKYF